MRTSTRGRNSIEPMNSEYLIVNTDRLQFELTNPNIKTIHNRALRLHNPNNAAVAFKIKSTTPFHYMVKPFEGSLDAGQTIQIVIKMILADRNIFKFNLDRFQILARPLQDHSDPNSRLFWQGAQSWRVSVQVIETYTKRQQIQRRPSQNCVSNIANKCSSNVLAETQYKLQQLQSEVKRLKQRTNQLKLKNLAAADINPWGIIMAAFASFILGFLFS